MGEGAVQTNSEVAKLVTADEERNRAAPCSSPKPVLAHMRLVVSHCRFLLGALVLVALVILASGGHLSEAHFRVIDTPTRCG